MRVMRRELQWRRVLLAGMAGLMLILVLPSVALPVTVAPMAVYISDRSRTGTLTLFNNGTRPEEIEIDFAFGYARSDSLGDVRVEFMDPAPSEEPSVVPFLRAFPQRIRLAPGQRQIVRLLVNPPAELPDGEYWGRVLVSSIGGQAPVEQTLGDVRVNLQIKTVIAVAVNYRHGLVETGLTEHSARASMQGDTAQLFLDLEREGNAAYLGRVRAELLDSRGAVIASVTEDVAVYRRVLWRVDVPLPPELADHEPAAIRYVVETERPDEADEDILDAEPVRGTVAIDPGDDRDDDPGDAATSGG